jgi:hypothetical protein
MDAHAPVTAVGEIQQVTARGKTITRVIWERPCAVCGAPFRTSLPKGVSPEMLAEYVTCFAHSADKRRRKARRRARARQRSPNRKRYQLADESPRPVIAMTWSSATTKIAPGCDPDDIACAVALRTMVPKSCG